jgi:hypothetical protein
VDFCYAEVLKDLLHFHEFESLLAGSSSRLRDLFSAMVVNSKRYLTHRSNSQAPNQPLLLIRADSFCVIPCSNLQASTPQLPNFEGFNYAARGISFGQQ